MFSRVFVLALLCTAVAYGYETEEDVIVGTDANLPDIIKDNEHVLVEFYAPWCGHCQHLAPEYASAAGTLKKDGSAVKLVKVDATQHSKSAEEQGVQGYPTLKWFKNGQVSDYTGGRTAKEIITWINKKSGPPAVAVADVEAVKKLATDNEVVVLGIFDDVEGAEAKAFSTAADRSENPFAITSSKDIAAEYKVTAPAVVLLKQFDEGRADYTGKFEADDISAFVVANQLPLVIEFNDQTAQKIFGGEIKKHMLLFLKKSDSGFDSLKGAMSEAAQEHKGKILFVYVDADVDEHERIMEFFGLDSNSLPAVRIIDLEADMAKYKPEGDEISGAILTKFAGDFLAGNLKQHLKSEKTPADWDAKPVKVLTGENFASVAQAEGKHALVEFYAPWCGHCKQLVPVWDKLGAAFEKTDNVVIAKIDSTANEIEGISIRSFPTIKFFPADNSEPVDYDGERDLSNFVKFINERAGTSVSVSDEDEEEDDSNAHEEL